MGIGMYGPQIQDQRKTSYAYAIGAIKNIVILLQQIVVDG
jgi:hypothetical protein